MNLLTTTDLRHLEALLDLNHGSLHVRAGERFDASPIDADYYVRRGRAKDVARGTAHDIPFHEPVLAGNVVVHHGNVGDADTDASGDQAGQGDAPAFDLDTATDEQVRAEAKRRGYDIHPNTGSVNLRKRFAELAATADA